MNSIELQRQSEPAVMSAAKAILVVGVILTVSGFFYYFLFPYISKDAEIWFIPWLDNIINRGPIQTLVITPTYLPEDTPYTPPYFYLLTVGSLAYPMLTQFTIIKALAIGGTLMCAACMYYLVRYFLSSKAALLSAAGVFLLPTIALNGAMWGQCDTYYASFILLTVAQALRGKYVTMMLAFGAALSFKLQAVFIGPFLLYVILSRRPSLWVVPLPAAVYALVMVPAWLAGKPAGELATIYVDQAQAFGWLSMNAPNPWTFIQYLHLMSQPMGLIVGLLIAGAVGIMLASLGIRHRLEGGDLLLLALSSAAAMPYLLPKMTERYFIIAELLSYALAFVAPGRWTIMVAVAIQLGSLGAYLTLLSGYRIGTGLGIFALGFAVVSIFVCLVKGRIASGTAVTLRERVG